MKKNSCFILGSILVTCFLFVSVRAAWHNTNNSSESYEVRGLSEADGLILKTDVGLEDGSYSPVGAPVPEPATMLLFGVGLAGCVGMINIRKKKNDLGYRV